MTSCLKIELLNWEELVDSVSESVLCYNKQDTFLLVKVKAFVHSSVDRILQEYIERVELEARIERRIDYCVQCGGIWLVRYFKVDSAMTSYTALVCREVDNKIYVLEAVIPTEEDFEVFRCQLPELLNGIDFEKVPLMGAVLDLGDRRVKISSSRNVHAASCKDGVALFVGPDRFYTITEKGRMRYLDCLPNAVRVVHVSVGECDLDVLVYGEADYEKDLRFQEVI